MKYRVAVFVCCFVSFAQYASANMTTALKESYGLTKVTLEVLAMCGSSGYRQDGAQVIILHFGDKFIRVGAFADNYTDIYNFDRLEKKLAWSSNKTGPLMGKVSVYESNCTAVY